MNRLSPPSIAFSSALRWTAMAALAMAVAGTLAPLVPGLSGRDVLAQPAGQSTLPGAWESVANGDRVRRLLTQGDTVWSATDGGGVVHWQLGDGSYRQYLAPQDGLLSNDVYDLAVTTDGTLWAGTSRGLARYDESLDRFETLFPGNSPGMPSRVVSALEAMSDGRIWVGFRQEYAPEVVDPTSRLTGSFLRGGLAIYDPVSEAWQSEQHVEIEGTWAKPVFKKLPSENITALAYGSDGILWIGTEPYYVWEKNQCTGEDCPLEAGYWVYAGGGLAATKDGAWQNWTTADSQAGTCYRDHIRDLKADSSARMWVATSDGVMVMRNGLQRTGCEAQVRYGLSVRGGPGLRGRSTWSVDIDDEGLVWIANGQGRTSGYGVSVLEHNNSLDDWSSWDPDDLWEHIDLNGFPGPSEFVVTAIDWIGPNRVLMGTQGLTNGDGDGIAVLDPSNMTWRQLRTSDNGLPSNQIVDVRANPVSGDLWVTTVSRGVAVFDGSSWRNFRMFGAGPEVTRTTVAANKGVQGLPTELEDRAAFDVAFPTSPRYVRIGTDPTMYRVTNYTATNKSIRVTPGLKMAAPAGTPIYRVARGPASDAASQIAFDAQGRTWVGGRESVWVDKCAEWPHCWLDGGLGMWDGQNWTVYELTPEETGLTSRDKEVQAVEVDQRGRVWAGTGNPSEGLDGKGIFVLETNGTWTLYDQKGINTKYFGSDGIADIAMDPATGDMWVAHHSVEICDKSSPFGDECQPSYTGGGVSHFNGASWEKWTKRTGAPLKAAGNDGELDVIAIDRVAGRVFVGGFDTSASGFHWGDGRGLHATLNWCPLAGCSNTSWQSQTWTEEGAVAAIEADSEGRIWVGTHRWGNGIAPPTGGIRLLEGDTWTSFTSDNTGLPSNEITALRADGEDMWVGTLDAGLVHYGLTVKPTPTTAARTPRPTSTPTRDSTIEPTPTVPVGFSPTATRRPTSATPGCGEGGCVVLLPFLYQDNKCWPRCPTLTPKPTSRFTATATATRPSATPTTAAATETELPSSTPTDSPEPTAPAETPTPSRTPSPTQTAAPSDTPTATAPAMGTWSVYQFSGRPPTDAFYSVHGTDASHVWFVGERSQVLYWDGTQMYSQTQGVPTDKTLRNVWAQSDVRAFIVGDGSTFIETRNGGQLWRTTGNQTYVDDWRAVNVTRSDGGLIGWALGHENGNRLLFDGTQWNPQSPGDRNNRTHKYSDVAMIGAAAAVAIQDNATGARIYTWDGTQWSAGPSSGPLYSLDVRSATSGVAVGSRGSVWRLNADGQWQSMDVKPSTAGNDLLGVHMVSEDRIWAVGERGGIYVWDGTTWSSKAVPGKVNDLRAVWLTPDGSEGWAVGDGGLFLRYQ